jgi:hypothetical protein
MTLKSKQTGEFNPTRIGLVIVILIGMLTVPLYLFNKRNEAKQAEQLAIEKAKNMPGKNPSGKEAGPEVAQAPAPVLANNPDRFGLTFGWKDGAASCHGEPKGGMGQPHEGSCNPYKGDTTCRTVMPIMCVKARGAGGGTAAPDMGVNSSNEVAGFLIASQDDGDARCVKDLGEGWKMAHFHQAGGWEFKYAPANGLRGEARHWVAIKDQPGNCWDPA